MYGRMQELSTDPGTMTISQLQTLGNVRALGHLSAVREKALVLPRPEPCEILSPGRDRKV